MNIIPISAFQDNYIWLLISDDNECVCVDPGDARPVLEFLKKHQLILTGIMITHHHYDHTGGIDNLILEFPGISVYGPNDKRIPQITTSLSEKDCINIFNLPYEIISIPGHTSTHIAYYNPTEPMLFCGDTLFSAGCGRVFDGTTRDLYQSLQRINQLPDPTKIYCAHEYTLNNCQFAKTVEPKNNTVSDKIKQLLSNPNGCSLPTDLSTEKQINPFLRAIDGTLMSKEYQQTSAYETFKLLRHLKDDF